MRRRTLLAVLAVVATLALTASASAAAGDSVPTGERTLGQSTLEAAYDAAHAGSIGYLLTPNKAPDPVQANPASWAPIYIPVYPVGSTAATTLNCMHSPVENCPDHGDLVAGAAQAIMPSVYGGGVLGHDHVLDFPGGDDFDIAWQPVLVLFTSTAAANEHLLTDAAILAARDRGDVILVPAPQLTFNCAVVPAAVWDRATPIA
jgi:hypothetical protein